METHVPSNSSKDPGGVNTTSQDPVEVVLAFIDRLNAQDVQGMTALMTTDHLFTDSLGDQMRGRENMRQSWIAYFFLVPDFTITCSSIFRRENEIALFGTAQGTLKSDKHLPAGGAWQMPAAWKATVRNGLVAEWQVYADNEPVRRLMHQSAGEL
jgi:ketosteroid isomerase-like protein